MLHGNWLAKDQTSLVQSLDRSSDNPRKCKLAVMLNQETGYICAKGTKHLNTLSDEKGKARLTKKRKLDDMPQSSQSGHAGLIWEKTAKSGTKSGLCFPKGEPRTTKKVNQPNT